MPSPNDLDLLNETFGVPNPDNKSETSPSDATDMVALLQDDDKTQRMIAA